MLYIFFILFFTPLYSETINCPIENIINHRSLYSVGDTISVADQNILFPVCNGSDNYDTGDDFSLADLNGNLNEGEYKITLISMNATW